MGVEAEEQPQVADSAGFAILNRITYSLDGYPHRDPQRENRILLGSSACRRSDVYII